MGKNSGVPWTDHSWSPWYGGCSPRGPECANCYARWDMKRYGKDPDVLTLAGRATFRGPLAMDTWTVRDDDVDDLVKLVNELAKTLEHARRRIAEIWCPPRVFETPPAADIQPLGDGEQRMLIAKIKRTDATHADLFGRGHKYPDLKLFELADLLAVGISPDELPTGIEVPCRFFAVYTLSTKTNKQGNPYKDVVRLERGE